MAGLWIRLQIWKTTMSVRIHPALKFYLTEAFVLYEDGVPTYRRNMFQSTEIFDLDGLDKRLPRITKLAYCIHVISLSSALFETSSMCDSGPVRLFHTKHDTIIFPKRSQTKQTNNQPIIYFVVL
jgi:hypothetical protein